MCIRDRYNRSATLLNELITILKGTDKAEESLYMLGMSYYNQKDYQTAAQTFITYFNTYPRGTFTELARFHAGKALFLDTPEPVSYTHLFHRYCTFSFAPGTGSCFPKE